MRNDIRILSISEAPNFLDNVIALADANRRTLGFLPRDAFKVQASQGKILIATVDDEFAGYLLYRTLKQTLKAAITHLCVRDKFRRLGIGAQLVQALKVETSDLWGISLNCRSDYTSATALWQSEGFVAVHEKEGRSKDGSTLFHWLYTHRNHQNLAEEAWLKSSSDKLKIAIDYCVFLDIEEERHEEPNGLGADWLNEYVQYWPTSESFNELTRCDSRELRKKRSSTLKNYPIIEEDIAQAGVTEKIRDILFGQKKTSRNDDSDARQIAHASLGGAQIFLTRDEKVLEHASQLGDLLAMQILHPREFLAGFDHIIGLAGSDAERLQGSTNVTLERAAAELQRLSSRFYRGASGERKKDLLRNLRHAQDPRHDGSRLSLLRARGEEIALAALYRKGDSYQVAALRAVKSNNLSADLAINALLRQICDQALKESVAFVHIQDQHLLETTAKELHRNGFRRLAGESGWGRLLLEGHVDINDAPSLVSRTVQELGMQHLFKSSDLESALSPLSDGGGIPAAVVLRLERLLHPLRLVGSSCPTYVMPIKPSWALHLFDSRLASQDLYGSEEHLAFSDENVYYRASVPGIPHSHARILWYVSDSKRHAGAKSIRAISNMDGIDIGPATELYRKYQKLGVYRWHNVLDLAGSAESKIMAVRFSNTHELKRPVGFEEANEIIQEVKGSKNNFQCPVKVDDQVLKEVLTRV